MSLLLFVLLVIAPSLIAGQATRVATCGCFHDITGAASVDSAYYCGSSCGLAVCGITSDLCLATVVTQSDSQVRWGEAASQFDSLAQSGLGFSGDDKVAPLDEEFSVGRLIHYNRPIIDPASLVTLTIKLQIPSLGVVQDFSFQLTINETANDEEDPANCPFLLPNQPTLVACPDEITFPNDISGAQTILVGNFEYTLQLIGFRNTSLPSGPLQNTFVSGENGENSAFLFAKLVRTCPPVCDYGGAPQILDDPTGGTICQCDCTSAPACPPPKVFGPQCGCECPTAPLCEHPESIWNDELCVCECPAGICGAGQVRDPTTCSCTCADVQCNVTGQVGNPADACECGCFRGCAVDEDMGEPMFTNTTEECSCVYLAEAVSAGSIVAPAVGGVLVLALLLFLLVRQMQKKKYFDPDLWSSGDNAMAQANPLYVDSGNSGTNPLYAGN
jgi:hypothetical protein